MKIVLFCHSILSCWNNGHAHFLRGVARELLRRGHEVHVYEPGDGWSRMNAMKDGGTGVLEEAAVATRGVAVHTYRDDSVDLDRATDGAALIVVQEWTAPAVVAALGRHRAAGGRYLLLFHDSHHRSVTAPAQLEAFDLDGYDSVLAFGEVIRQAYLKHGWARRAFTWHEAADTALFRPLAAKRKDVDLIWIGNWGDEERSRELHSFLIEPASALGLRTRIHGVRYPEPVRACLAARGIDYAGWLPNHRAPEAYARARATVHVPRKPYCDALPGIPTIRVFEALACGIPLVSAPWRDEEHLFPAGAYLAAADGAAVRAGLALLLHDAEFARQQVEIGLRAISDRHTCAHRVDQLMTIAAALSGAERFAARRSPQAALQVRP